MTADRRDKNDRDREQRPYRTVGLSAGDATAGGGEPVDLSALQADDALLDALGSGNAGAERPMSDHQLSALLVSWRQEVDSEPIRELVDTETAFQVVSKAANRPTHGRHRLLVPLTSAAAVLIIAFTVVGFAARSAQPGDTLWSVTEVLYSTHAKSVETAGSVRNDLAQARVLLNRGDLVGARSILDRISGSIDCVQDEDGRADLIAQRAQLAQQLGDDPATPPSVPGTPPANQTTIAPKLPDPYTPSADNKPQPDQRPLPDTTPDTPTKPDDPATPTTTPDTPGTSTNGDHTGPGDPPPGDGSNVPSNNTPGDHNGAAGGDGQPGTTVTPGTTG